MRYLTLILLLIGLPVFAQDTSVTVQPKTVIGVRTAQGTAWVKVDTSLLRLPSGKKTFTPVETKYSWSRIKEIAKGKVNPAHAAMAAAMTAAAAAAGWIIDSNTGEYGTNKEIQPHKGTIYYTFINNVQTFGKTKNEACTTAEIAEWQTTCPPAYSPIVSTNCSQPAGQASGFCVVRNEFTPISAAQSNQLTYDAFSKLTPEQQRLFFEELNGSPAMTPELQAALQAKADAIKAAEGLNQADVENPNGETDTSNKPQEVTVKDPIKIDGSDINTSAPSTNDFINATDYAPLTNIINNLPTLPKLELPNFGLTYTSGCRTISFDWKGTSVPFPSTSQCAKLTEAKNITGWFISVITMFGIAWLILGKSKPGV